MRFELVILIITGLVIGNIYTDGKLVKTALSYKKYYQMMAVAFVGFMIYTLLRKNPTNARNIIATSNEYLKYMPVDRSTSSFISPILDFTSKYSNGELNSESPFLNLAQSSASTSSSADTRIIHSGIGATTKRSVSETKKKWVAANQGWKCGQCGKQLPPWFEVDHKIRLEHGGSNHVDNLVALCRDCHGEKTAIENL